MNGSEACTETVPTVEQASLNLRSLTWRRIVKAGGLASCGGWQLIVGKQACYFPVFGYDGALHPRCSLSSKRSASSHVFRRIALRYTAAVRFAALSQFFGILEKIRPFAYVASNNGIEAHSQIKQGHQCRVERGHCWSCS